MVFLVKSDLESHSPKVKSSGRVEEIGILFQSAKGCTYASQISQIL